MPDVSDAGIAATVSAALTGAVLAAKEALARRKKRKSDPPIDLDESEDGGSSQAALSAVRARLREQGARILTLEQSRNQDRQEIVMLKASIESKLGKVEEALDALERDFTRSRTTTDTLLPIIRGEVEALRREMAEDRRHKS